MTIETSWDVAATVGERLTSRPLDPRLAWHSKARPEQLLPGGKWRICYWQGGRGSGKTASGAGAMGDWILADTDGEGEYGIIAPTYADAWTKCVEGEAGLLQALGTSMAEIKDHRSATVKHAWRTYGQVILHSGIIVYIDSAAEGGLRIQGRNLKGAWCDEIGLWDKWELAWNESLKYAVRKGRAQIVATGTPKASRKARNLIRSLIRNDDEHGGVVIRKLRTIDNIANLAEAFALAVIGAARGTRLERQELEGELLDDVANALWTRDLMDTIHCDAIGAPGMPDFLRNIYVGVDPSDGSEDSDEQAYTVMGLGPPDDGHIYVAETWGGQEDPATFARRCIRVAQKWGATIVVEKNHGGKWLTTVFSQVQKEIGTSVRVEPVHASDAKRTRAEPVAAMYQRYADDGTPLVRHCHATGRDDLGHITMEDQDITELEDQMATFTGAAGERSPDRLDSLVWAGHKFLRQTFGPVVPGGIRKWALQAELDGIGVSPENRSMRKRLSGAHGGLLTNEIDGGGFDDLDSFAPKPDTEELDRARGSRGNIRHWS